MPNAFPGSSAQWGGLAGYLGYTPANQSFVTINTRVEWYQDAQGYTLAGFVWRRRRAPNLYEATVGANVTVFPDDPVMENLVLPVPKFASRCRQGFLQRRNQAFPIDLRHPRVLQILIRRSLSLNSPSPRDKSREATAGLWERPAFELSYPDIRDPSRRLSRMISGY